MLPKENIIEYLKYGYAREADLRGADLRGAVLRGAVLRGADLREAVLRGAVLREADLSRAVLIEADLRRAVLIEADLSEADLRRADLRRADLRNSKGLVKTMGVMKGNIYWKRFNTGLNNNGYQFYVGLNKLRSGEVFASDEREICSYPGFHFSSRSWCAFYYGNRPLEAKIRIPEGAQINEPWATDGKASSDMIEILQVYNIKTGEDVTSNFIKK